MLHHFVEHLHSHLLESDGHWQTASIQSMSGHEAMSLVEVRPGTDQLQETILRLQGIVIALDLPPVLDTPR
jgi:hypothetical protein